MSAVESEPAAGQEWGPIPSEPWHVIVPNLSVGGASAVPTGHEFDVVYTMSRSACLEAPSKGVPECVWFIADDEALPLSLRELFFTAESVVKSVRYGKRALVRCYAGLNRSALVAGMALRILGYEGEAAIGLIRDKRGPYALCNQFFHDLVKDGAYAVRTVRYQ